MSDYFDFKSKEEQNNKGTACMDNKTVNFVSGLWESQNSKCKTSPDVKEDVREVTRRRKLSAEKLISVIQRKATNFTANLRNSSTTKLKSSPEVSTCEIDPPETLVTDTSVETTNETSEKTLDPVLGVDRRKLTLPVNSRLSTIPSVDYQTDSEDEIVSPEKESQPQPSTPSSGGKGILKKVSNVEVPNIQVIQMSPKEEFPSNVTNVTNNNTNNSPSRMVKFDMPSFDSHASEELCVNEENDKMVQTCEEDASDVMTELSSVLLNLNNLETNINVDHVVLEQAGLKRLVLERIKWMQILRKALSNVLSLQSTIENILDDENVAFNLIHTDFADIETQTDENEECFDREKEDKEAQTENTYQSQADTESNTVNSQTTVDDMNVTCDNSNVDNVIEQPSSHSSIDVNDEDDVLNIDLGRLKFCAETDILEDYVIL